MRYTRIKGLGDELRTPRVGKIHLGVKVEGAKGTYPKASDYFVCPPEVQRVFGPAPRELPVLLPSDRTEEFFPVALKYYKTTVGLWCTGDGETAQRVQEDGTRTQVKCPCGFLDPPSEDKPAPCKAVGHLQVVIPQVSIGGIYQIDTGSYASIHAIYDGVEYARKLLRHVAWVPFTLALAPREVTRKGKKKTVYAMTLTLASFEAIREARARLGELRELVFGELAPAPATRMLEEPAEAEDLDLLGEEEPEAAPAPAAAPTATGTTDGKGAAPAPEPPAAPAATSGVARGIVSDIGTHDLGGGRKRVGIKIGGYWYGTSDPAIAKRLKELPGQPVVVDWAADPKQPLLRDVKGIMLEDAALATGTVK